MADDRSVFDRLDNVEATSEANNKMLAEVLGILQNQKQTPATQPQPQPSGPRVNSLSPFQQFLKQSKKSWRWFGTKAKFNKSKTLTIISLITLLIVGLVTTIVSTICFNLYSTFTFFENVWMIFGIIYLVYASKAQLTYEVNELAANSSTKYDTDQLGMKFPRKEKVVFKIFKWLAIISIPCNIIAIWAGMGKSNLALATVMELIFLGAVIFAIFMNFNLYAQYSIIWVEGHNLTTKEKVALVLPPGAKQLMPEEEFKKFMPMLYK